MICCAFNLSWPWTDKFKSLGSISGQLTQHKCWELEHYYYSRTLVELEFSVTSRADHAGLRTTVGLLGYSISATIYDSRHWDQDSDTWEIYGD
jgi:hypothetical protein